MHRSSDLVGIVGLDEDAGVTEDFGKRAAVGGDDRHAYRHRFQDREAEPLVE